jgi:hypothetical protein
VWIDSPLNCIIVSKYLLEALTCGSEIRGVIPPKIESPRVPVDRAQCYEILYHCIDNNIILEGDFDDYCDYTSVKLEQQAAEVAMGSNEHSTVTETESTIIGFVEAPTSYVAGDSFANASYNGDLTPDVALSNFLKRPVEIYSTTWNESDTVTTTANFFPWKAYLTNSYIKDKLKNYAYIKFDLKLKFMVNASPFYYGAKLVSYQPLQDFHAGGIPTTYQIRNNILYSQRPHIWIYPQNNEGGELTLPFLYYWNMVPLNYAINAENLGRIDLLNVVPLASANGVTGTGVSIVVYAWAENVTISGPTCQLLLQSDEYDGPVSSVASAVATGAGYLSKIPIIGRFATATQIGANAIASIASMFGFTNTPVISDTQPYRPNAFPVLASTEQGYPIDKLTVDPKNEVSVDPGCVGISPSDELMISNIASKESYLTSITWSTSHDPNRILFTAAVTPTLLDKPLTSNSERFLTPMAWVAMLFKYWRGDIIFRFKFVCTQYHRGRVRISYDPMGDNTNHIGSVSDTQTTVFNTVVDLTKDTNVEVRVPYCQALAWLKHDRTLARGWTASASPANYYEEKINNGILNVRVLTKLTAPVASSDVSFLVSVRAAENFELACPADIDSKISYFEIQSDSYECTESISIVAGHGPSTSDPNRYLINMGENVVSLRQLLHRYNFVTSTNDSLSGDDSFFTWTINRMPPTPGYDPTGRSTAVGLIATGSNFPYNFCAWTTISWISAAFIGQRGSVNWSFNPICDAELRCLYFGRNTVPNDPSESLGALTGGSKSKLVRSYMATTGIWSKNMAGQCLTNQLTQSGINTALPMYSAYKFNTTTPRNATKTVNVDDTSDQTGSLHAIWKSNTDSQFRIMSYCGAGVDFSLVFFLNVPVIYQQDSWPAAV